MFNYQNFDEVFSFDTDCSYDDDTVSEIEGNRKQLEGLFIENVMKLLGIKRREYWKVRLHISILADFKPQPRDTTLPSPMVTSETSTKLLSKAAAQITPKYLCYITYSSNLISPREEEITRLLSKRTLSCRRNTKFT